MIADLLSAANTGGEVRRAAAALGLSGRSLNAMTDDDLLRLCVAVWPTTYAAPAVPTEPREPGSDADVPYVRQPIVSGMTPEDEARFDKSIPF